MLRSIKDLVPSLLAMNWICVDTPTTNRQKEIYEHDKKEFGRMGKRRNAFIRVEHPSEFDWEVGLLERIKMPVLRVLVFRLSPGIHVRVPVFRGKEPCNVNVSSDSEIGIILEGMNRKLGMNLDECEAYEKTVITQSWNKREVVN